MQHPFGPNGPYFRCRCHRDQFPSQIEKVDGKGDSLSSSAIADMDARFIRGSRSANEAQRRAAQAAKEANVQPARLYLRSTSRGLRRMLDIYMPRFTQDEDFASSDSESEPEVH